jgi:hypothetical protein
MRKKPSFMRNFLSLNQHRKRWGAQKHILNYTDLGKLKKQIIKNGNPKQTRGSSKSLDQHLQDLRQEFSGQSELVFYHAKLIVLIRRGYKTKKSFEEFQILWANEQDYLKKKLNLRWLVAATDTFAEHSENFEVRSVAMMVSILANTIKIYETENYLSEHDEIIHAKSRITNTQSRLIPLFEGLSSFTVGTDDTLRHLVWRLKPFYGVNPSGVILEEVWQRLQTKHTAFSRLRHLHTSKTTKWWEEDFV